MQTIRDGGTERIVLAPGSVLFAKAIGVGSVATLSLDGADGAVSFTSADTKSNGSASAGPFDVVATVSAYVVGRAAISVVPMGSQSLVSGALIPGTVLSTRRRGGGSRRASIAQWQTTFGGYTWRQGIAIPGIATLARVAFPAHPTGTWTVDKLYVGAADTAGSVELGAGLSWAQGTFDGGTSASKVIPQAVLPIGYQSGVPFDHYWSDWMPVTTPAVTGKTYRIILVSLYSSTANTATVNAGGGDNGNWQTLPALPVWDAFKIGDLANGSLAGSSNPQTVPIWGVEWTSDSPAISLGSFADSIDYGASLTPQGTGWPVGTAAALSTLTGGSVSCVSAAISGDPVINSMNRFRRLAARGSLPDICIYRPYSRNAPVPSLEARMGYVDEFVQTCLAADSMPILACGIAETSTPANNANNDATTTALIAYCADRGIPILRFDQVITPANAASMLADGVHPNATGDTAMTNHASAVIQPYAAALMGL